MHYNDHPHVRAAIGHTTNLDIYGIPTLTDRDVCTCLWNKAHNNENILIISAYWDNLDNNIPPMLELAINTANTKGYQFILCIDSNAHNTLWGSKTTNTRGRTMEEFIAQHNLEIQNRGNQPTFRTFRENRLMESIIDLTITSNKSSQPLTYWKVSNSYEGSDHRMIHFTVDTIRIHKEMSYNFSKCKWHDFRQLLQSNWHDLPTKWDKNTVESETEMI
jgi:hypothetical protein